jgi:hypothetical protein
MKNFTIVFTRASVSESFASANDTALDEHIRVTYSGNPIKSVGTQSVISEDLLTLIITRRFVTEADATAFAQDPVIVAWLATLPGQTAGITA